MESRIKHHNLLVSNLLDEFVKTEMLKGLNITPNHFWKSLSIIVNKFTPKNKNLLAERKDMQFRIDKWHKENKHNKSDIKEKAREVVEFLNLGHLSNELAGNLSGGQKKLLELGRTMMVDAKLVLLDEVGAGVNRTLLKDLGTAIEKLNKEKGYTFCMIEHDMDFIGRLCDPVIVMAEGSVLFEGSVDDADRGKMDIIQMDPEEGAAALVSGEFGFGGEDRKSVV